MRTFRLLAWYYLVCLSLLSSGTGWAQDLPTFKLVARDGKRAYRLSRTAAWLGRAGIFCLLGAGILVVAARR